MQTCRPPVLAAFFIALSCAGCLHSPSTDETTKPAFIERPFDPADVVLEEGYRIELVAKNLTFPTSVTFDEQGHVYVLEAGYCYGEACAFPRLLRIDEGGDRSVLLTGRNGPWTGVVYHEGAFFIAEGGEFHGGRVLRFENGKTKVLIDYLPSIGDHHTNGPAIGPDGKVYFSIGSATNSGVVGADNADMGWMSRYPEFHDVPCWDIVLTGKNFETAARKEGEGRVTTGAYLPYGTKSTPGQKIEGRIPCTGAVFRIPRAGGEPELVAWGFRNPFGMAFGPDQQLYVADSGFDVRGSRPIFGASDPLWRVTEGTWYGFPDFAEGRPVFGKDYQPPGDRVPARLLERFPNIPPEPIARLAVHSSSTGLDFSRSDGFGFAGQAFVAQFGDMATATGRTRTSVGYKVVRVDPASGVVRDFAVNRGRTNGPSSLLGNRGLERPIAVRFDPSGRHLYIVDFGIMTVTDGKPHPRQLTGAVFRVSRTADQ